MHTNLKEKIKEAVKIKSLNEIVKKSEERFKPKIFAEKYLSIYRGTPIIRIFFSLFSVVTGVCFFLSISDSINFYFSLFLGISLYSIVELLKGKMIQISLTEFLQKEINIISVFSAFFGVILFGLSIFCSVKGAESLYTHVDTTEQDLKAEYTINKAELEDKYTFELKELKTSKNDYIELVSYRGKINIHNTTNKQTLANYEIRISEKEAERKRVFKKMELEEIENLALSNQKQLFNTEIWVFISLLIEFSILACLVFVSFYEFNTYLENELLRSYDLPNVSENALKPTFKLKNEAIGFQVNQVETSKKVDFIEKKQVLEFLIKRGINDFKILAKLGFNFKQISSAIQNIN